MKLLLLHLLFFVLSDQFDLVAYLKQLMDIIENIS